MNNDEVQPLGKAAVAIATLDNETTPIRSGALAVGGPRPFSEASGSINAALTPPSAVAKVASTMVALSKFVVANGKADEVKEAFGHRPRMADGQPGFNRMEVVSPLDRPDEIWLLTFWTDAAGFHSPHHSHLLSRFA